MTFLETNFTLSFIRVLSPGEGKLRDVVGKCALLLLEDGGWFSQSFPSIQAPTAFSLVISPDQRSQLSFEIKDLKSHFLQFPEATSI